MLCVYMKFHACIYIYIYVGVTIGFERTLYSVDEDVQVVDVCAEIVRGNLRRNAVVRLQTSDGTAIGKLNLK